MDNNKEQQKQNDLSVEEILKSIKAIVNKEFDKTNTSSEEDVLELTTEVSNQSSTISQQPIQNKSLISEDKASKTRELLKEFADKALDASKEQQFDSDHCPQMTVEELVVDLVKPRLSSWLEDNLERIVRNVVSQEIQKLVPGKKQER